MHTCPPPKEALALWLKTYGSIRDGNYGHLLLEQQGEATKLLLDALRPYFESAHLDAREHFHKKVGINLHPDAAGTTDIAYPTSLPNKAKRGLFGEVLAGLVTEAYQEHYVGGHAWSVPIFLFREHDDVEKFLWALKFDPGRVREIYGRHGTDFVGIALGDGGEVVRVIAGEAKWRKTLNDSTVAALMYGPKVRNKETQELEHTGRGIWFEVNRDTPIPHGLRQLQFLLERCDPDSYAAAILSIDRAVLELGAPPPRTDLIVIAGNGAANRGDAESLLDWEHRPADYKAARDLQVVEVILTKGDALIDALYDSLWSDA